MPIKKGTVNLSNIKKGSQEIAKVYKGTDLVFNRDAPVWLAYKNTPDIDEIWYSLDGINYTKITEWSGILIYNLYGAIEKKFVLSKTNEHKKIRLYDLAALRKGNLSYTESNFTTGNYYSYNGATNGDKVIVIDNADNNYKSPHYSLDGGKTWATVSGSGSSKTIGIQYIGKWNNNDYFRVYNKDSFQKAGRYYIWRSDSPTTCYYINYYLPDNTQTTSDSWLSLNNKAMHRCEDGAVYVIDDENKAQYRGTYTQASDVVTLSDATSSKWYLHDITYCYGKYYGIFPRYYDNGSTELYVSTDGINFSPIKNDGNNFFRRRGGRVSSLSKCNGKLCFAGAHGCGVINSDHTVSYTAMAGVSSDYCYNIICNKFNKSSSNGLLIYDDNT